MRTSVVIPIYGSNYLLDRALESIASQIVRPDEVIVVDDASPTAIAIPHNPGGWPFPILLVRTDVNGGGGFARNAGVKSATGEIVIFLDHDDAMKPDYVANIIAAWKTTSPDVGLIAVGFYWCKETLTPYRTQSVSSSMAVTVETLLAKGNFVGGVSVISVRRDAFLVSGGFPELRASQDWGLLLAMANRYVIKTLSTPYVYYMSPTYNSSSITRSSRRAILAVCSIYRLYDPSGRRGREYQHKSSVIAYFLMRSGRPALGRRVIAYSIFRFRSVNRLLLKATFTSVLSQEMQSQIVNAFRTAIGSIRMRQTNSHKTRF